ncbi:hypothetical protein M9H77_23799 [Catharanthus roseus]|uniref:Uncharacterized protein n=1 Tax=Catharanthus roseus TaxID=4058 RepID=A0ACC0AV34_CATRO|nr:hypothetical protein M9H77_23799 [Catharanthus roseus]
MDPFEDFEQENVKPEEYIDHGHLFTTDRIFNSKDELVNWAKQIVIKANTYLIVNRYQKSRTSNRRPYVTLACERGGSVRKKTKQIVDDVEEEAARLTEEQLQQIEQFRKNHVPPRNILRFFREQGVGCALKVWTSEVLHFSVETTNRAESEHSVLKLWLSTCHGDLDSVFLNIDSVIESQIAEIKSSLEISKLKEKYDTKINLILKNLSNRISHMAMKKIWLEIERASKISDDPESKCGHYLRKSHGLPCACELYHWYQYLLPLVSEDVYIFLEKTKNWC